MGMERVIGTQMVDEAQWNPLGMYIINENALPKIGAIDPTLPIYISDGWDPRHPLKYARSRIESKAWQQILLSSTHTCTTRSLKRHFSRTAGAYT